MKHSERKHLSSTFENGTFEKMVDGWVYQSFLNGVTNFNSLIRELPGVYPTVAFDSFRRLVESGRISTNQRKISRASETNGSSSRSVFRPPVIQHPLDFDWRFTPAAAEFLHKECEMRVASGKTVALLGVPSLCILATSRGDARRYVFIDKNPLPYTSLDSTALNLEFLQKDLLYDAIPNLGAELVIADPPWYPDQMKGFLWSAAQTCADGGTILASVPPVGTRPGIREEITELSEWVQTIGLGKPTIQAGMLPYQTSLFEHNALNHAGITGLPIDWRRGDLAIFTKLHLTTCVRPEPTSAEPEWLEEEFDGVRIKIRPYDEEEFLDPTLLRVVTGDILQSVSRRDPIRELVDVWTSGNRIFACVGRNVLHNILYAFKNGVDPERHVSMRISRPLTTSERDLVKKTHAKLGQLFELEQEEARRFYGS